MHKDLIMNFLVLNIKNLLIANALTESLALYSGSVLQASTPPPFLLFKGQLYSRLSVSSQII